MKMSTIENEVNFRKKSELNPTLEAQFNGSTEFILMTDHRTSKYNKLSQEQLDADGADAQHCCMNSVKKVFRKKTLYRRLPILSWLPRYTRMDAISDLIAGVTVGLTAVPQGMAYSGVVGLPVEFGLYGSFMGCFVYVLLGTCKDSTIGSTAVASLMTYQFAKGVWQRAVLLTFITGFIELIMAMLKLGCLVEFVSGPVSAGYTSAVALIVSTSQMKYILGVNSDGASFLQRWISMIRDIQNIRVSDTCLGFGCVALLLLMRSIGRIRLGSKDETQRTQVQRIINRFLWFFGVMRNVMVAIVFGGVAMYLHRQGRNPFILTGYIPPGLPGFALPPFSIEAQPGNATAGVAPVQSESFFEMINNLGYGLIIVPLIALLENITVCKAFAKGKPIDTTQELFAMGAANIANSLVKGYRSNGGLARSAINNASGVRTCMSNVYIGLVVVLALQCFTEYFSFIPKAVLAAILISAVIFQVQYQTVVPMWRSKRTDLIPGILALITCLVLPLEIGVLVAVGANLLFILYHSARPKITLETLETEEGQKFVKITPDRCLIFPSVEFVRNLVLKSGSKTALPVVIDCTYIYAADYTAAKVISSMVEDFRLREQKLIFFNLKPSVVHIFEGLQTKLLLCYNMHALSQELSAGTSPIAIANSNEPYDRAEAGGASESVSNASTVTLTRI